VDWHFCSENPSSRGRLEALIAESIAGGWGADSISSALAGSAVRVRLAEGGDGLLLGFVLARRVVDLLEIDLVGVRPEQRRCGVARSLIESLIEDEVGMGLAEARLELAASNDPARGLYEGLGFMVVGRRKRYYPDGDDALLLSRMISSGRSAPPQ
jgi:ribosomal-protein-alanine N-acetyltransferase